MGASRALLDSPERIAQWARQFRAESIGAFQLIWIPEESVLEPDERAERMHAASQFLRKFGTPSEPDEPDPDRPVFSEQCDAMLAARPTAISSIMGLFPREFVTRMRERGIAWLCCATSLAEALAAEAASADAIVAPGMEAGGHRGTFSEDEADRNDVGLFSLLPWFPTVRNPDHRRGGIADGVQSLPHVPAASAVQVAAPRFSAARKRASAGSGLRPWTGFAPENTVSTRALHRSPRPRCGHSYLAAWTTPGAPRPAPFPTARPGQS